MEKVELEFEPRHDWDGTLFYVAKLPENKEEAKKIKEAVSKYNTLKKSTDTLTLRIDFSGEYLLVMHERDVTTDMLRTAVKIIQRMLETPVTKKFTLYI